MKKKLHIMSPLKNISTWILLALYPSFILLMISIFIFSN